MAMIKYKDKTTGEFKPLNVPITHLSTGAIAGDTLPIGFIGSYPSSEIPDNWLLCNGDWVEIDKYPELYAVLGDTYSEHEDGMFKLPDFQGKVLTGMNPIDEDFGGVGAEGGEKTHTHDTTGAYADAISTGSTFLENYIVVPQRPMQLSFATGTQTSTTVTNYYGIPIKGNVQNASNLQPYSSVNFIIKAYQAIPVIAEVEDNLESTSNVNALSANMGRELNEKITPQRIRQTGTDLNDYKENGTFVFTGDETPLNIPTGTNGTLVVIKPNDEVIIKQIWLRTGTSNINDSNTYTRIFQNGEWSNWSKYLTTQEIDDYVTFGGLAIGQIDYTITEAEYDELLALLE